PEERLLMLEGQPPEPQQAAPPDLPARLEAVRAQGYEMMDSAQVAGVSNLSVPIFGPLGSVIAVLTCPYTQRLDKLDAPDRQSALAMLQAVGQEISQRAPRSA
ncbi:MAG TPA: IclR family transcriptional regulator C-terminal domain-containing protein, partial [Devosia sp.]|nr:IclR family transcriptional regulator C-terminal domain-containing protein [Devosia sp.]